jgi:hypothetical protein
MNPLQEHTMNATLSSHEAAQFELGFQSLLHEGRAFAFPCDEAGHVDIDALGTQARLNYFYARTVIGREVATPAVQRRELH